MNFSRHMATRTFSVLVLARHGSLAGTEVIAALRGL